MKFIRLILLVCGVLSMLTGCRPEGILSAGKMEDVLVDLHRADGILYVKGYAYGRDETTAKYYEVVLQKNGVTQAVFDSSIVWYTDHPQRFNKIYPKVLARLEDEKQILAAYNQKLEGKKKVEKVDTVPLRPLEEWLDIMQNGLPVYWNRDTTTVDTAFLYPYLETLQDSLQAIQQTMQQDTLAIDSVHS